MARFYLRFVQYEQNRAGELRIRGAGPTLAYEIVGPTTGSQSASALTCLCLHGNRSHDHAGVARLLLAAGAVPGEDTGHASPAVQAVLS